MAKVWAARVAMNVNISVNTRYVVLDLIKNPLGAAKPLLDSQEN